jgi:hypothetical protein
MNTTVTYLAEYFLLLGLVMIQKVIILCVITLDVVAPLRADKNLLFKMKWGGKVISGAFYYFLN